MKYFCKFCNSPMENVKSFFEYKSNQFCNKCFDKRVESLEIEGLKNDDLKIYNIDITGMDNTDINKIFKDLFDIDLEENSDDNSDS